MRILFLSYAILRFPPFWDVPWGRLVIGYRRFGAAYRFLFQGWNKKKSQKSENLSRTATEASNHLLQVFAAW